MRAGALKRLVSIERRAGATDSWASPLPDAWELVAEVYADIRHPSGSEAIRADAQSSSVKASIRIRFREDITAAMRVRCAGVKYDVKAVLPDLQKRRHVDLVCEVVT